MRIIVAIGTFFFFVFYVVVRLFGEKIDSSEVQAMWWTPWTAEKVAKFCTRMDTIYKNKECPAIHQKRFAFAKKMAVLLDVYQDTQYLRDKCGGNRYANTLDD